MPLTPHIVVQGADRAAAFYRDAFGAEEVSRIPTPDGRLPYRWDDEGDRVTIAVSYGPLDSIFTGSWREDGTFSGGWRPNPGADETVNIAYDIGGSSLE